MLEIILDVNLMLETMQVLEQDQTLEVMQEAILDVNLILEVASMHKRYSLVEYLFYVL